MPKEAPRSRKTAPKRPQHCLPEARQRPTTRSQPTSMRSLTRHPGSRGRDCRSSGVQGTRVQGQAGAEKAEDQEEEEEEKEDGDNDEDVDEDEDEGEEEEHNEEEQEEATRAPPSRQVRFGRFGSTTASRPSVRLAVMMSNPDYSPCVANGWGLN